MCAMELSGNARRAQARSYGMSGARWRPGALLRDGGLVYFRAGERVRLPMRLQPHLVGVT